MNTRYLTNAKLNALADSYADGVRVELNREAAGLPNAWRYQLDCLHEFALVLNARLDDEIEARRIQALTEPYGRAAEIIERADVTAVKILKDAKLSVKIHEMFERTQGTAEALYTYRYQHSEIDKNDPGAWGTSAHHNEAINAMAEDIRAFEVPERVIEMHVTRMRRMVGVDA